MGSRYLRQPREDFVFSAPHTLFPNPVDNQLPNTTSNENQNVFLLGKDENDEVFISGGKYFASKNLPKNETFGTSGRHHLTETQNFLTLSFV